MHTTLLHHQIHVCGTPSRAWHVAHELACIILFRAMPSNDILPASTHIAITPHEHSDQYQSGKDDAVDWRAVCGDVCLISANVSVCVYG